MQEHHTQDKLFKFQGWLFNHRKAYFLISFAFNLLSVAILLAEKAFLHKSINAIELISYALFIIFSLLIIFYGLAFYLAAFITRKIYSRKFKGEAFGPIGIGRGTFYIGEKVTVVRHGLEAISDAILGLFGLFMWLTAMLIFLMALSQFAGLLFK